MVNFRNTAFRALQIAIVATLFCVSLFAQSKNPMILVPGLTGSELRDKKTKEKVWIKAFKSDKSDDIRLPISPDIVSMGDDLVPGDVIRNVEVAGVNVRDVYGGFVKRMTAAGYHEEKWDEVPAKGIDNALYVFPYDWRLDNVANARLLVKKIEELKAKLKRPDVRFDLVAHSMGGIISRYAAMYGDTELPAGKPVPTWVGAKAIDKVILLGVPNEGAISSLDAFINGVSYGGLRLDLPFLQDTSRFTAFTLPATYELLPAPGTLKAYDERLESVDVDLYDPKVWLKYGWNPIDDDKFPDNFNLADRRVAQPFFEAMLARAKRLHDALAAGDGKPLGVTFLTVGSDCKPAPDAIVIYRDRLTAKWKTLFKPKGFTRSDGQKVSDSDLKKIMLATGDGVVTQRSSETKTQSGLLKVNSVLNAPPGKYFCDEHNHLAADDDIQNYIIQVLKGDASKPAKTVAKKTDQE
jgi:pimeloyl-ACP methyl ester carboxylesterase